MKNRFLTLTLATIVLLGMNGMAVAQNPLRLHAHTPILQAPQSNGSIQSTNQINPSDATAEVIAAINNYGGSHANSTNSHQDSSPTASQRSPASGRSPEIITDRNVAPAVHLAEPKNDIAPFIQLLDSLPNNVQPENSADTLRPNRLKQPARDRLTSPRNTPRLETSLRPTPAELESTVGNQPSESPAASKQFDREKFQALIKQLAINTGFVMCVGIGFILIAKQYYKGKSSGQKNKSKLPIRITSTLKLSPKSNLHLIETGEHQLIVAADQNGIKSMVRLTDSFADTLGSLDDVASEFSDEPGEQHPKSETSNAGIYTLATLGQMQADRAPANRDDSGNQELGNQNLGNQNLSNTSIENAAGKTTGQPGKPDVTREDEIRSQMEAALREYGLKDLILETLQKE